MRLIKSNGHYHSPMRIKILLYQPTDFLLDLRSRPSFFVSWSFGGSVGGIGVASTVCSGLAAWGLCLGPLFLFRDFGAVDFRLLLFGVVDWLLFTFAPLLSVTSALDLRDCLRDRGEEVIFTGVFLPILESQGDGWLKLQRAFSNHLLTCQHEHNFVEWWQMYSKFWMKQRTEQFLFSMTTE